MSKVSKKRDANAPTTEVVNTEIQSMAENYVKQVREYNAEIENLKAQSHAMFGAKAEEVAWKLAVTMFNIVHDPYFKEMFGSQKNLATTVNMSRSSITKMVNAVETRKFLRQNTDIEVDKLSRTQIEESMPFVNVAKESNNLGKVVEVFTKITTDTDAKTVREICTKAKKEIKGEPEVDGFTEVIKEFNDTIKHTVSKVKQDVIKYSDFCNVLREVGNIILACSSTKNERAFDAFWDSLRDYASSETFADSIPDLVAEMEKAEANDNDRWADE